MPDTHGRSTRRFKAMAATVRARRERCTYCGQPIDYELHYTHAASFTVAHWLSVRDHPELAEQWSNIRGAAHRACNSEAGADNEPLGLGLTSGAAGEAQKIQGPGPRGHESWPKISPRGSDRGRARGAR